MNEKTKRFLELVNQANADIAAREAQQEKQKEIGTDPVRLQRDAERREKLGQLRAREHTSKRPHRARFVATSEGYSTRPDL